MRSPVVMIGISQVALYYGVKWIMQQMDPMRKKKEEAKAKAKAVKGRLNLEEVELNDYEEVIMSEVVHPGDIHTSFDGKYLFGDGTDK
jgi:3-deoxy-D-arabino-heptulosonate 7-phosphate (DAHP) synthase class II